MQYASKITGIGSHFPQRVMTNQDLARELAAKGIETNDEWIVERTGIRERRISEPGNPKETNSSLALVAATRALEMAGKTVDDIDQILFATCSPDSLVPTSACWLQTKLGAKRAWALDINAACSGFVYGLAIADTFIRTGQVKTSLVIGSEVLNPMVNWDDRGSCILFGDGSGAAIVERTEAANPRRILSTHLHTDGSLWEVLYVPAGGSARPLTAELIEQKANTMHMKGKEIFKVAVKTLTDFAVTALETNGLTIKDLDWFVPHQANLRIIEAVAKRLDFPMDKVLVNIDRHGNTSAATVPTALDEAVRAGKVKPGQTVLMDVFGAGLTYGAVLARW
ncbi:MAG: ketoacyl-ACP synthase III [Bdellovibrionales bacterium]|nr:ketoacyl-ACP synthase III [Bdellovibrionales bacterium]